MAAARRDRVGTRRSTNDARNRVHHHEQSAAQQLTGMFDIELLGRFCLRDDDGELLSVRSTKIRQLLVYLSLQPGCEASRTELISLLWDPDQEVRGRTSLRQCLSQLGKLVDPKDADTGMPLRPGPPMLLREQGVLRLNPEAVRIDVVDLLACQALPAGQAGRDLARSWTGELLPGDDAGDGEFWDWLRAQREFVRLHREGLLLDALQAAVEAGDTHATREFSLTLLRSNPLHEVAYQRLLRLELEASHWPAAQRLASVMRAAFDKDERPFAEETVRLLQAVDRAANGANGHGQQLSPPPAIPVAAGGRPEVATRPQARIAVLPLRVIAPSSSHSHEALAHLWNGTVEDIRSRLAYFRNCSVLSGLVSDHYMASAGNAVAALHREAGVDYALDGSVTVLGERLMLRFSLIDTASCTQTPVCTIEPFAHSELAAKHEQVVVQVAHAIDKTITDAQLASSLGKGTTDMSAFDHWARAHQLYRDFTRDSDEASIRHLRRAVLADPDFARPYLYWASVANSRRFLQPGDDAIMRAHLDTAVEKSGLAVDLDPDYARSRLARAWALLHAGEVEEATGQFSQALALNPYDSDVLIAAAVASAYLGRTLPPDHLTAVKLAERAWHLCPAHQPDYYRVYRAIVLHLNGAFEEALEDLTAVAHTVADGQAWLAFTLFELGLHADATRAADGFRQEVAQQWDGDATPTDGDIIRWFWQVTPVQRPTSRQAITRALDAVGFSDGGHQPRAARPVDGTPVSGLSR